MEDSGIFIRGWGRYCKRFGEMFFYKENQYFAQNVWAGAPTKYTTEEVTITAVDQDRGVGADVSLSNPPPPLQPRHPTTLITFKHTHGLAASFGVTKKDPGSWTPYLLDLTDKQTDT